MFGLSWMLVGVLAAGLFLHTSHSEEIDFDKIEDKDFPFSENGTLIDVSSGKDSKAAYVCGPPRSTKCPNKTCCGYDYRCGTGQNFCGRGCRSQWGMCGSGNGDYMCSMSAYDWCQKVCGSSVSCSYTDGCPGCKAGCVLSHGKLC